MFIDARGLEHPEHLKEFKRRLAGLCLVNEDVEVLIDNRDRELKMFKLMSVLLTAPIPWSGQANR